MMQHRPFASLGRFDNEWLSARYHFDFANYRGAPRRHVGPLIVWNDDQIRPGTGFDPHSHRDMEIITYVRRGAITHKDGLGNEGRTGAGDVQVMSAGAGIVHSEFNLESVPTLLFQIWVFPRERGIKPRWKTAQFPQVDRGGRLVPLASGQSGVSGALAIDQDATLYGAHLSAGQELSHPLPNGRCAYLVNASGRIDVDQLALGPRDGLIIEDERRIQVRATEDSEILLFDLPVMA